MNTSKHIAKHLREIYFGGNWTCSNLKQHLSNVSWQQATTRLDDLNTIATLTYHINYYVNAVTKVLQGEALNAKDEYSFIHPPIQSQKEWEHFLNAIWDNAETFARLIEDLPETKLWENLSEEKYGVYYRNLHGIIEHAHYHLGQIVIIKKLLLQKEKL